MASAWDVEQAAFDRLQPVLAALTPSVPLHHDAPPATPMPFATIARAVLTPDDGFDHYLTQVLLTLAVYSDHVGKKQVLQVMEAIRATLIDARLALPDGETIRCRYERMDTAHDSDGRTHVGTIIFSILFRH